MASQETEFLTSDAITCPHGFFTTLGGVSSGIYESLNCGWGAQDDPANVTTNRALVVQSLGQGVSDLLSAYQVHSNKVRIVEKIWTRESAPEVDAMVTDKPGVALGILTADCVPVLFHDADQNIIGAAHAGWKGALTGVLENTIQAMVGLGAQRAAIKAAIGPCIHQASYEVDSGFRDRFLKEDAASEDFFIMARRADHFQFDLPGYVFRRLEKAGLEKITPSMADTYSEEGRFFSYRRTTHKGEADYGRHISVIALKA